MIPGGAGAPAAAHSARIAARTASAVSGRPSCWSSPSRGAGAADQRLGGGHAPLGRALGAADALELGRRLGAAARLDRLRVDLDADAALAQPVGERHRQVAGHDGRLDPPAPDGPQRHLELRLVARRAVGEHLVEAELVDAAAARRPGSASAIRARLERAGEDRGAAVLDGHQQSSTISSGTSCRTAG